MKKVVLITAVSATAVVLTGSLVLVGWGSLRALTRQAPAPITVQHQGAAAVAPGAQGAGSGQAHQGDTGNGAGGERQYPNAGEAVTGRETLQGTVVVGTDTSNDIVVSTAGGEQVTVGSGPEWLQSQGFALVAGDQVTIVGYWEDGEFKAAEITRLSDGATIVLRDASGRPAWSGAGQRAQARDAEGGGASNAQGQGQGGGQGRNRR